MTALDLDDFDIGRVVMSKRGKDKGAFYVVVGKDESSNRVCVADGKSRKIARPKKKNPRHLQLTKWSFPELRERLEGDRKIDDEWIRQRLSSI